MTQDSFARVLVVDDNRTSRLMARKALMQLSCRVIEAESGLRALELLESERFDLVLLDIEMPEMDGLAVLRWMNETGHRRNCPVLVVSGLDGDMGVVVAAIELGAEDFLPKPFDPTLFRARVTTCIEKKRLREVETDHLSQMDKLTHAAQVMESGRFHPQGLGLDQVAARPDAIGRLAGVFVEMATQVYDRERALQRYVRTLLGGGLLLAQGLLWGLVVPLSVMIYQENPLTLGVSFWSNLVAGVICCAWALAKGRSLWVSRSELVFLLQWAALFALSSVVLFEAAGRVSGIVLSIIMALQGFAVFAIAAALRIEAPSLRRFLGLGLGLVGVLALLLARDTAAGGNDWLWLLAAIAVPLLYGAIDIVIAVKHPPTLDSFVSSGLVLILSALLVLPLALLRGHYYTLGAELSVNDALVALVGLLVGVCTVLYIRLIALAGAVFGSQSAYAITVAGIAWSVVLLGEVLTGWTIVVLIMVISGLALVGPKREAGNIEVEFRRRGRARGGRHARA